MLKEFEWKERYRFGIPQIDDQHLELVKRINNLVIAFNDEKSRQEIAEIVAFLEGYVVIHFNEEEKFMAENRYIGLEQHRAIHDEYMRKVDALACEMRAGEVTPALMVEVNRLLIEWLSRHIDEEDRKFAESIAAEGAP